MTKEKTPKKRVSQNAHYCLMLGLILGMIAGGCAGYVSALNSEQCHIMGVDWQETTQQLLEKYDCSGTIFQNYKGEFWCYQMYDCIGDNCRMRSIMLGQI